MQNVAIDNLVKVTKYNCDKNTLKSSKSYKLQINILHTKSQSHMPQNHSLTCHKITVSHATTDNDNSVALNLLMALII